MKKAANAFFRMHETLDVCPFSQQRMLNQNGIYFQISSSPCESVKRASRTFRAAPKNKKKCSAVPESQCRVVVLDGRQPACVLRLALPSLPVSLMISGNCSSPERNRHGTSLSPHETLPEKAARLEDGYKFLADFDSIVLTGNTARRRKLSSAMLRIIRSLHWISFSYGRSDNLSYICVSI